MLELIRRFFQNNLDITFFIYGLAFVVMGIAILVQPRRGSEFKLANILWLLAGFGLTHGTNEWLDMWTIIKGRNPALDMARWFILVISYFFLFEFGRQIFRLTGPKPSLWRKRIAKLFVWWLAPTIGAFVLVAGLTSLDFWTTGSIWTRYLLGFPGGLLICAGLLFYYADEKRRISEPVKVKRYFFGASLSFLVYGILGGLVVPKGNFFPSNWFNTDSFLLAVKVPVQAFRAGCAIVSAWSISGILTIFNREAIIIIQNALAKEKEAKEMLRCSKEFSETILNSIDDAISIIDVHDFRIIGVNRAFLDELGLKEEEVLGKTCYEITHHRADPCTPPEDTCPLFDTLKTGKTTVYEHMHYRKDGGKINVEVSTSPIKDERGEVVQVVHVARDITERKRMESMLIQSEKLASLGRLVSDMAHEVNNPLMVISGRAELAAMEGTKDKEIKESFKIIQEQCDRAKDVIHRLLMFSKPSKGEVKEVDINSSIDYIVGLIEHQYNLRNIKIVKSYAPSLPAIKVDEKQIQEVFMNLLSNAADAMPKGGDITISTSKEGERIRIDFKDTGSGMSKEVMQKAFDPFFSTKEGGTGLGLSVCYGIMKAHGGELKYKSEPGRGTTASILLPVGGGET